MASDAKWYFTADQLATSPSRKCGMDADQELIYRQRAANLIQDMGQRLHVSQLCINTAIVYMHRFFAFHSFTKFHRNSIAAAALFLAAKVEEQPRKLEHVIKVANICLNADNPETSKDTYPDQAQDLVFNENVLLQTLGFDVAIDHPHTHVVKTCHLVKASKDLAQTSYFMASNSLHLTTMCLQYKPTVVACFCIHLACQWSRWEIPQSTEGKHWFHYVDKTVTLDLLKQLTEEFLHIFDKCPSRLKSKMKSISATAHAKEGGMPVGNATTAKFEDNPSNHQKHHDRAHHHHARKVHERGSGHPSSSGESKSQQPSTSHKTSNPTPGMSGAANVKRRTAEAPTSTVTSTSSSQSVPAITANKPQDGSERSRSQQRHPHQESSSSGLKNRPGYPPTAQKSASSSEQRHPAAATSKAQPETMPIKTSSKNPTDHKTSQPNKAYPHPSAFNQTNSSNNRTSTHQDAQSAPTSVPQQQQHIKPETSSTSSFRLIDDSNRISESMQICTPPKQSSKPTSIFSPDWDDTEPAPIINLKATRPPSNTSSIFNTKPKTDSPKKEKHRSETPHKKEKRSSEQSTTPTSQKQQPGPPDSKKVKTIPNIVCALPKQSQINQDIKPSIQSQKRSFSSTQDLIKQEDGIDFREQKVRKLDTDLFGQDLPENMFDVKPTKQLPPQLFNTNSNSNSQFDQFDAFNSIKESKPVLKTFSGSQIVNGIETNPDYVNSLLQESLSSNDMKFTSTSLNTLNPITPLSSINSFSNLGPAKKLHDTSSGYGSIGQIPSELPETILEPLVHSTIVEPIVVSEEGEHHHRNKSKKKKDKHKHKDRSKDKEERSKDKEERKKHKKDKERKEREKDDPGPFKIIFSKGDTEATGPFKIKIPKESIRGDLNAPQSSQTPPSSLKIKISKDKFENYGNKFYNNNNDAAASAPGISGNQGNMSSMLPSVADAAPQVHKKKDREKERKDRDRSKGKHNNNNMPEFNKSNGGPAGAPQMFSSTQNVVNNQRLTNPAQQMMGLMQQQAQAMSTTLPNPNKMPPQMQIPSLQNYNQMFNSNYQQQQQQQQLQQQQQQNYNNYYQNNNYANNSANQNKSNSVNK